MVFSLFKRKVEVPAAAPAVPLARIAKAADIDVSTLQPPAAAMPVAPESARAVETMPELKLAPPQVRPDEMMLPYYKIPKEFWQAPFAAYLGKELKLDPEESWNRITLPAGPKDVTILRTVQHPKQTFPLHLAVVSTALPQLQAAFEREAAALIALGEGPGKTGYTTLVTRNRREIMALGEYVIQLSIGEAIARQEFFPDPMKSKLYMTDSVPVFAKPQPVDAAKLDFTDPATIKRFGLLPFHVVPAEFWSNEFGLFMKNTLSLDCDGAWNTAMLPATPENAERLSMYQHPGRHDENHVAGVRQMLRMISAEYAMKSSQLSIEGGDSSGLLAELMFATSDKVKAMAKMHLQKLMTPLPRETESDAA